MCGSLHTTFPIFSCVCILMDSPHSNSLNANVITECPPSATTTSGSSK